MMCDLEHAKARQAVRLAKENLRRCQRQFATQRNDDQTTQFVDIEEAEGRLAEANAKLRALGE
jgi:hypothetical protein